jgi:hypothetical protein
MLGVSTCDVGCMVKPSLLNCLLDLLFYDIWKYSYRWLFDLGIGAKSSAVLRRWLYYVALVHLHGTHVKEMVDHMKGGPTFEDEHHAL